MKIPKLMTVAILPIFILLIPIINSTSDNQPTVGFYIQNIPGLQKIDPSTQWYTVRGVDKTGILYKSVVISLHVPPGMSYFTDILGFANLDSRPVRTCITVKHKISGRMFTVFDLYLKKGNSVVLNISLLKPDSSACFILRPGESVTINLKIYPRADRYRANFSVLFVSEAVENSWKPFNIKP